MQDQASEEGNATHTCNQHGDEFPPYIRPTTNMTRANIGSNPEHDSYNGHDRASNWHYMVEEVLVLEPGGDREQGDADYHHEEGNLDVGFLPGFGHAALIVDDGASGTCTDETPHEPTDHDVAGDVDVDPGTDGKACCDAKNEGRDRPSDHLVVVVGRGEPLGSVQDVERAEAADGQSQTGHKSHESPVDHGKLHGEMVGGTRVAPTAYQF